MAYARIRAQVSLAVKGSGLVALLLASVVLLGGFIDKLDKLGKKDFWCVTAITVIQAAGIFEDWENSLDYLINSLESIDSLVLNGLVTLKGALIFILSLLLLESFMFLILCFELIFMLGPLASAAISAWRIAKLNHGKRDGTDSMMAALNLFYSLVIFQGIMFGVLLLTLSIGEWALATHLHSVDPLRSEKWAKKAIHKYISDISKKCRNNPRSIKGTDLIKYGVELLDSESQEDYLYGARLLSAFIKKQGEDVRSLLLPSTYKIQKLIESLGISSSLLDDTCLEKISHWSRRCVAVMSNLDDKREIRELAATIVADLAGHIDLAKYPESMQYISSLLQEETTQTYRNIKQVPYPQRLTRQQFNLIELEKERRWNLLRDQKGMMERKERRPKNREGDASYELILQGLTILDKLASNKDNCSLICGAPGLLPKITAPLYSKDLIGDVTNRAWSDIVTMSLKLLHKLIRAPESISMSLRKEISSNVQALSNLKSILNLSSEAGQELQLPTMEILTELAVDFSINLDKATKEILITKQCKVFLDNGEGGESATIAGRTLVSLSESNSYLITNTRKDITDRLTELLDAKNSIIRRTIAAEIMENLCAHSGVDKKYMKETLLPKVLKEIISFKRESQQRNMSPGQNNSATADQNKLSDQESENQEAFLSLTLAIFKELDSADDFDDTIHKTVGVGRENFVDKLKSIINDNREAIPGSLRIVKLCGRIAESMMQCQQYQQYADHFRNKGFESLLSQASETMSRLESCMLFLGTDFGLKKTVRPLIRDIHLERKLNLEPVEHALQEAA